LHKGKRFGIVPRGKPLKTPNYGRVRLKTEGKRGEVQLCLEEGNLGNTSSMM